MAVDVEPRLLEVLACPCPRHGALREGLADDPQADYLSCEVCGRSFPVRDGIPVLLLEEAVEPPADPAPRARGKG